jgi:hypothetical protein
VPRAPVNYTTFLLLYTGADPEGGAPGARPPLKLEKYDFLAQNRDFSHEIQQKF